MYIGEESSSLFGVASGHLRAGEVVCFCVFWFKLLCILPVCFVAFCLLIYFVLTYQKTLGKYLRFSKSLISNSLANLLFNW